MIPLIPTLGLAFLSFFSSAFVILRVIIPILPPHPLSSRVAPKEFGLPNFKTLSNSDKVHVYFAAFDLLSLSVFLWEALTEYMGQPQNAAGADSALSSARLWIALTTRQTSIALVAFVTLLYLRLGKPVTFGKKHWILWVPSVLVVTASTAVAAVLAGVGVSSLFWGVIGYTSGVAILSTAAFTGIVMTLLAIRKNLAIAEETGEPWPPVQDEKQPRPSFATEEIDAMKDGSSWITSYAGSHRHSMSAFSFSTTQTGVTNGSFRGGHPISASATSLPTKSAFWFSPVSPSGRDSPVPPVPPLPAPYRPSSPSPSSDSLHEDPDPFRATPQAPRMGSQSSWLTEGSGSQHTISAWSFPTSHSHVNLAATSTADVRSMLMSGQTRSNTPAFSSARVLGGYGYAPSPTLAAAENGLSKLSTSSSTKEIDISPYRLIGWLVLIWVPLAFTIPYLLLVSSTSSAINAVTPVLLILGVTLSSPLLAFNLVFCPMPIPVGLFETNLDSSMIQGLPVLPSTNDFASRYKSSGSVTVVEGRRSGDVWIAKGDAVDHRSKFSRAASMLAPVPKLSVLPPSPSVEEDIGEITPPLPLQNEPSTPSAFNSTVTGQSENSVEIGRGTRMESKNNSVGVAFEEGTMPVATRIMTAQRHYSAIAKTLVLPPSPDNEGRQSMQSMQSAYSDVKDLEDPQSAYSTSAEPRPHRRNAHLRSRSASSAYKSSISGPRSPISPPPSSPLPPTPPEKEVSDISGFSFNAVDDINEIDALSAKLLPLLIPGLKVGPQMKVTESPLKSGGMTTAFTSTSSFSSPDQTSTPMNTKKGKHSAKKRHHLSLPSLGLSRESLLSLTNWKDDITRALANKFGDVSEDGRRRTVVGAMSSESFGHTASLKPVEEEEEIVIQPATPMSAGSTLAQRLAGHRFSPKDVPDGVNTARSSMATLIAALEMPPQSAGSVASFRTSFSDEPIAESTPPTGRMSDLYTPPIHALTHDNPAPAKRRSSIIYIKSDENSPPSGAEDRKRLSGSIRPLVLKSENAAVRSAKASKAINSGAGSVSPKGLKRLSLLQQRDLNVMPVSPEVSEPSSDFSAKSGIRPLILNKKYKAKERQSPGYDGVTAMSTPRNHLARSATSKARGLLRQDEILPDVYVRPPSQSESHGFMYSFR